MVAPTSSPSSDDNQQVTTTTNYNTGNNLFNEKPDLSWPSIRLYLATRLSTLLEIPMIHSDKTVLQTLNPFPALLEMTAMNWNFYFLGFLAWTVDAMDFFCVLVSASEIAASLNVNITQITWGITLVLMFRAIGAIIFGILSDYYGRKWPFIFNCFLFIVLEIGTGFVTNYGGFLGVRAIFGIAMGGMYGNAAVTALESQPTKAKSVLSGFFLPGYNLGYLLAIVFYRGFRNTYKEGEGWRALFWFSAGLPVILIIWRFFMPESDVYLKMKEAKKQQMQRERQIQMENETRGISTNQSSWKDKIDPSILITMKSEWLMFIYLVLLMTGFNFMSHATQDLYPTYLQRQRNFSFNDRTVIMVLANIGGMVGGVVVGQLSELLGRRLSIIIWCVIGGAMLYPAFFSLDVGGLLGGDFALVFCVMGTYGIIPIHLMELVNATHRTFLSGLVYQLGNLISLPSATIAAKIGAQFPIIVPGLTNAYNYGKVMALFTCAVFVYNIIIAFVGPERFHRDLHVHSDHLSISEIRDSDDEEKVGSKHIEKAELK